MKALIIYMSTHHGNTEKVAKRMAEALGADLMKAGEVTDPLIVKKYDLVGFGSGIYFGAFHRALLDLVDKLPISKGAKAFVFSTSGAKQDSFFNKSRKSGFSEKLAGKGFLVIDEFNCLAFDTFGPMGLIGGLNKGRPDEKDLKAAEEFAKSLPAKMRKNGD